MGRVGVEGLTAKDLNAALLHTKEALALAQKQIDALKKSRDRNKVCLFVRIFLNRIQKLKGECVYFCVCLCVHALPDYVCGCVGVGMRVF